MAIQVRWQSPLVEPIVALTALQLNCCADAAEICLRGATSGSDAHLIVRHAVVGQHADQDQRVGAAMVLDDVDVGVDVKHPLQSLRQTMAGRLGRVWQPLLTDANSFHPMTVQTMPRTGGGACTSANASLCSLLASSPMLLISVPSTSASPPVSTDINKEVVVQMQMLLEITTVRIVDVLVCGQSPVTKRYERRHAAAAVPATGRCNLSAQEYSRRCRT